MPFNLFKQRKTYIKQIERKSSKQEEKRREKPRSYFSLNEVKKGLHTHHPESLQVEIDINVYSSRHRLYNIGKNLRGFYRSTIHNRIIFLTDCISKLLNL
jgi:hypothetical protein